MSKIDWEKYKKKKDVKSMPFVDESTSKRIIGFGRYQGKRYSELPEGYLVWITKNITNEYIKKNVFEELERRRR